MTVSFCSATLAMMNLAATATQAWLPTLVGTYTDTDSRGIYSMLFNQETGESELTAVTDAVNPSFVVFSNDNRNVYAVNESGTDDDAVVAFRYEGIDKPLVRLNAMPTGKAPCNLLQVADHVLTANYTGGSISDFLLETDGSIKENLTVHQFELTGPAPDKERQQSAHLHCVKTDPYEWRLFACDLGNDCIYTLKAVADSKHLVVDSVYRVAPGSGPRHITFDESGRHAYVVTELSGEVIVFDHWEGTLTQVQTVTCDDCHARGSADIHLSADGQFLYASNRLQGDGIAIFRVDEATGLLTRVGYQPTAVHPRNFAITPNGKFLLCACRDSNCIQVFAIDKETGLLTDTHQSVSVPHPVCIAFEN